MNHQRLRCYGVLLEVAQRLPALRAGMRRRDGYLEDQLKRALSSALLNLAEGNGRTSPKERARFFDFSIASADEASSAIDLLEAFGLIPIGEGSELRTKLAVAAAMIRKLRKS